MIALAACGPGTRNGTGDDDDTTPVDAPTSTVDGDPNAGGQTYVYAHTSDALYRVDPDTLAITKVGAFGWSSGSDQMTDIAIDKTGMMIGTSFTAVYRIDPTSAKAQQLSSALDQSFNGLSFIPAAQIGQTGDDVLVATRNEDGAVFRIDPTNGQTTQIGNMGGGLVSSGDLVAVANFGTVQTVIGSSSDQLVKLAPNTFTATKTPMETGFSQIWGVAFWKNKIFGFTQGGDFILIDPTSGKGTLQQSGGPAWWGAAVTTLAPIIQ